MCGRARNLSGPTAVAGTPRPPNFPTRPQSILQDGVCLRSPPTTLRPASTGVAQQYSILLPKMVSNLQGNSLSISPKKKESQYPNGASLPTTDKTLAFPLDSPLSPPAPAPPRVLNLGALTPDHGGLSNLHSPHR